MSYFIMENEELILVEEESLPEELEELYQKIRRMYIIQYSRSDWASDTGDSGMGYDFDNSYQILREPERREMVIGDGKLVGFYIGFAGKVKLENKATKEYFLKLEEGAEICRGTSTVRYGNSKAWKLHIKAEPSTLEHVCLFWVEEEDREHIFTPADFGCEFIESVVDKCKWQDGYGYFDGAFRVTVKLTAEGAENADEVLKVLEKYQPIMVSL